MHMLYYIYYLIAVLLVNNACGIRPRVELPVPILCILDVTQPQLCEWFRLQDSTKCRWRFFLKESHLVRNRLHKYKCLSSIRTHYAFGPIDQFWRCVQNQHTKEALLVWGLLLHSLFLKSLSDTSIFQPDIRNLQFEDYL